ncbi:MAG TPA: N-acyl homoserine lactonase family protein [Bryobacteraceae bacterium]|nr:N-acyl homoserine lactonase family protein [Bryobacteraceae bacterium]
MTNRRSFLSALWCALALAVTAFMPAASAQTPKAKPPKSLRLYVFDCGTLDIPDTANYGLKPEELVTKNMSVACFLVAHPKGTLMWDTGAVPDGNFKPGGGPGTMRYATSLRPLAADLADIGYRPADITYLALSHFHWDHIGNSNLFAGSTWLVKQAERDIMFSDPPSPRTEPANFAALKNSKTTIITKDEYDVFGDGSVIIKAAPGHSPAHQVLFLKLKQTGPVVLSGDLYHYPEERKLGKIPTNEFNPAQTATSRAEIEAFLKKTGAQLWIQHDLTANRKLKKSPAFYE